jgi:spermidine synthase
MRDAYSRDLGLRARFPALLLGFMAASFQVYLLREFSAQFYGNELTFGLFLGSWLLWGGLGSLAKPSSQADPDGSRLARLYGLSIGLFFASLVVLRFSHDLMGILPAELTGLGPALGFALALSLVVSFPLGHYFVLNAGLLGGDASLVYLLESAGAAVAGLFVHFVLVPRFSNWQGAAVVGAMTAALTLAALKPARKRGPLLAAVLLAVGLAAFDLTTQKASWKPLQLVETADTPYGKLQVIRNAEQVTLFDNGLAVFTHPDVGAAEESVHFALLQRGGARRVLLIGGGAGGGVAEALKYPDVTIDYVELDPAIIGLAEKYLAAPDRAALTDPRVRVFHQDGRAFLLSAEERYDAVILGLPEPATAQINRYFTWEFFWEVHGKLAPGGVLSFVVPSAENYISDALAQFLGSIAATARAAFPEVVMVPGANCVFLASSAPLNIEPGWLSERIAGLGLRNSFIRPEMLPARLAPLRVAQLIERISGQPARINRDLFPVSYYFHSILWAGQFRGLESSLLRAAGRVPSGWLLDAPLILLGIGLAFLAAAKRNSPVRFVVPIAVMGLTSIVVEFAVLLVFQANFGTVYGKIPLLLASFMAGLVLGSFLSRRRRRPDVADLLIVQGLLALALIGYPPSRVAAAAPGEVFAYALLLGFGALSGYLFVAANALFLRESSHRGLAYGVDLLASFAGVALASGFLIPLFGIPAIIGRVFILNVLCFLYLLFILVLSKVRI